MKKTVVILDSGDGIHLDNLVKCINNGELNITIRCIVVDRNCKATDVAERHGISHYQLARKNNESTNLHVLAILCHQVDLIISTGYLSVINKNFIDLFPEKIINIHASLLPKFSGLGMYGLKLHQAVIDAGEKETGCTAHLVDKGVHTGVILAQKTVDISPLDDAKSLQEKVRELELFMLPAVLKIIFSEASS